MSTVDSLARHLLEVLDDGLLLAEADADPAGGRILAANGMAAALTGTSPAGLAGRAPLLVASQGLDDVTVARIRNALAQHQAFRGESVWQLPGAEPVPVEVAVLPIGEHADGRPAHWIWQFRDLQERRLLEQQVWQAQRMETVGLLASGIAHDFNNILTALGGYTSILMGQLPAGDPRRADAQEIERAASEAGMLIDHLLAFSRRDPPEPQLLDLNQSLRDLLPVLERLAGEHIHVVLEPGNLPGGILADPRQLQQIVYNLVANSRDAMPQGGTIIVSTASPASALAMPGSLHDRLAGAHVMLSVTDDGAGMDAETRAQLFRPFFTTRDPAERSGLGLATVHGLVRRLGGYAWVASEPLKGTTVRIYLPISAGPEGAAPGATDEAAPVVGGEETILLVEDQPALLRLMHRLLAGFGYRVVPAGSAAEATALAAELGDQVDLLVTDIVMPGQHGPDLAAELLSDHPAMGVLCISGYPEMADRLARTGHDFATLQKPFTAEELAREVRSVLDRRSP